MVGDFDDGAALQESRLTPYDSIVYPSHVSHDTDPDRWAAIARLHGLAAPPIATARVLEIGGGDGLNASALAVAFPHATFLSFDLAETQVRVGQALARAAGLNNIRIEQMDIVDAATSLEGEFDYVIVHGIYAWVPKDVQSATMALIARVLAPDGIAFISYNAKPGGQIGQIMREMALHAIGDETDPERRLAIGRETLQRFVDSSLVTGPLIDQLKARAQELLDRPPGVVAHDEFGAHFDPQKLTEVCAAAATAGLDYLNDATRAPFTEGLPGEAYADQPDLIRHLQSNDYDSLCFFRESLFVRSGRKIERKLDPTRAAGLWLSAAVERVEGQHLSLSGNKIEIRDDAICDLLLEAGRIYPRRVQLTGFDAEQLEVFVRLLDLAARRFPAVRMFQGQSSAAAVSRHPRVSPLALAQIDRGDDALATMDHGMNRIAGVNDQAFVRLLDGTRDHATLAREMDVPDVKVIEEILAVTSHAGLLIA